MTIECDVLVIGGGPAGLSAGKSAVENGLKTVIIEEDKQIGVPVQCAEAIGKYLFPFMPFNIPKEQLIWTIEGMYLWANEIAIIKKGGIWEAYSINREKWDKWLASRAKSQGARLLLNTYLKKIEYDSRYNVNKAILEKDGKELIIKPQYLVAADGVNSTVIKCLGVKEKYSLGHVKSYEMKFLNLKYPRYEQLFFGDFAPGAYAYIFPTSQTSANVGIGTLKNKDKIEILFENFTNIPFVKKQLKEGEKVIEKSGDAPIRDISKKIVYGNIFLVGDSANQNIKPFIEGNIPSIICGNILGNFLFKLHNGEHNPDDYPSIINEKFNLIAKSQPYADLVYAESKIDSEIFNLILLGLMSNLIEPDEDQISKFISIGYQNLKKYIMKNGGFIEK